MHLYCILLTECLIQGLNGIYDTRERLYTTMSFSLASKWTPDSWPLCFSPSFVAHENERKQLWLTLDWGHCSAVADSILPPTLYYRAAERTPIYAVEQLQIWYSVFVSVMLCAGTLSSLKSKGVVITCVSSCGYPFLSPAEERMVSSGNRELVQQIFEHTGLLCQGWLGSKWEVSRAVAHTQQSFQANATPVLRCWGLRCHTGVRFKDWCKVSVCSLPQYRLSCAASKPIYCPALSQSSTCSAVYVQTLIHQLKKKHAL